LIYIYSFIQIGFQFILFVASFFNAKAKLATEGRKLWRQKLKNIVPLNENYIWVHCSSLGEFEQGRPVIEKMKAEFPLYKIVLTFFSPSGYAIRKNYKSADLVMYLPFDTLSNANFFIETLKPKLVLFVKYDIWINYIYACVRFKIPVILFSAKFRKTQHYFNKWYGTIFLNALKKMEIIFVQDDNSESILNKHGVIKTIVANDTRIDRVIEMENQVTKLDWVEKFKSTQKLIVLGSTWLNDYNIVLQAIEKFENYKCIIVPHHVDKKRIAEIIQQIKLNFCVLSELQNEDLLNAKLKYIIVDTIGILTSIYPYADLVYIGGGFGKGIHNTQEPSVFEKPILIGPNYKKFKEAVDLVDKKGMQIINTTEDFEFYLNDYIHNIDSYKNLGRLNKQYLLEHSGGTVILMNYIRKILK
jgi:3-deoxy-D-manno-octulosonic-acid transferase